MCVYICVCVQLAIGYADHVRMRRLKDAELYMLEVHIYIYIYISAFINVQLLHIYCSGSN